MSFKTKNRKKSQFDTRVTLDAKYNDKVKYFCDKQESLLDKLNKLGLLKGTLESYNSIPNKDLESDDLEKKLDTIDRIKALENEISNINSNKEDINYLLDTGNLLFNYYDTINVNKEKIKKKVSQIVNPVPNQKSVMDYFKKGKLVNSSPLAQSSESNSDSNSYSNYNSKTNPSKAKLYEEYLARTNDNDIILDNVEDKNVELCLTCNVERKLYMSEGKLICPRCGDEIFILIDSDKPSYKEPPREVSYFAYRRINHLNECLWTTIKIKRILNYCAYKRQMNKRI